MQIGRKIVSDISEGGSNIKNTLTGKQLVDDVATKENINKAKKTFNQVKKVTKKIKFMLIKIFCVKWD